MPNWDHEDLKSAEFKKEDALPMEPPMTRLFGMDSTKDIKTAKPTKLSEVDRLRIENQSLKIRVLGSEVARMQHGLQQAQQEGVKLRAEFDALRAEFKERYGVDPALVHIDAEGNISQPKG